MVIINHYKGIKAIAGVRFGIIILAHFGFNDGLSERVMASLLSAYFFLINIFMEYLLIIVFNYTRSYLYLCLLAGGVAL